MRKNNPMTRVKGQIERSISATGQQRVATLMAQAFKGPREARSAAYKAGVRDMLTQMLCSQTVKLPYTQGTAEADAWFSGLHEGRAIAKVQP